MADGDDFLSRWSRRKLQANKTPTGDQTEDRQVQAPALPQSPNATGAAASPETQSTQLAMQADAQAVVQPAVPNLQDVQALSSDSDFSRFVAAKTPQIVKNAALKKLFSDPHFNIMDGLDIYIDDYGLPDPLPDGWLEKLEHAKGWLTPTDKEREAAAQAAASADTPAAAAAPENTVEPENQIAQAPLDENLDEVAGTQNCDNLSTDEPT